MRILHLIGGGDTGGAKTHIITLASRLREYCGVKLVSFREGPFAEDCRRAGIDVAIIENHALSKDYKALLRIIDDFGPDMLHCHGARANMMGVMVKLRRKIPTITTIHSDYKLDYMHSRIKHYSFGVINRICLRYVDYYNCVADRTARMMISRGFAPSEIFTIYNGIDFDIEKKTIDREAYLARFGLRLEAGEILCGTLARLTAVKDVATLIRGFAAALEKGAPLRLLIGGDGEDRAGLEALCREMGIADRVHFAGWIEDNQSFFQALHINVLSSISETFPYSVLEGVREGCATICSDVGGMPELIDSGENGFIFSPGDAPQLGEQLYRLAMDSELREGFARKLRDKAGRNFSLFNTAKTQYETYQKALKHWKAAKERSGVLICGAYGKGNAGDDAILRAIINEMREIQPDMPLCVMSRRPMDTALEYRVDSIFTFMLPAMHRRMKKARLYINGGGSLIQDVTSNRSLYFYLYTLAAAKRRGAKVMMYGCGIGPVSSEKNRRRTAKVLNRWVDTITLREDDSLRELASMGVTRPRIVTAADPALTLAPAGTEEVNAAFHQAGIPTKGRYFCLCVRAWPGFDAAIPAIAEAAAYAKAKYGLEPLLLPIEMPRDEQAGDRLARQMRDTPYIFRRSYSTGTTIGILSRMQCVLSMRLHALIFAARVQTPHAGIVYDQKVEGFMRYMQADLYADLEDIDAPTLCGFVDAMMQSDKAQLAENAARLIGLERKNIAEAAALMGEKI